MQRRRYIPGKQITCAAALRLFEFIKKRPATAAEKKEFYDAWKRRRQPKQPSS